VILKTKVHGIIVKIMQNTEKRGFIGTIKQIFNVRVWSDADRVKSYAYYIMNTVKLLFIPQAPKMEIETFKEAQQRLNLTDEQLELRKNALYRLSLVMFAFGTCVFFYAIYQLLYGRIPGLVLTLAIMSVVFVLGFRYHFWYFQIKEKRLGCTLAEWFKHGLLGEKR
jgi:intracellular multiplication protein IcmV